MCGIPDSSLGWREVGKGWAARPSRRTASSFLPDCPPQPPTWLLSLPEFSLWSHRGLSCGVLACPWWRWTTLRPGRDLPYPIPVLGPPGLGLVSGRQLPPQPQAKPPL